ncbi:MAG: DNA polymerase III subunit gamma/tau [Rhodospirillaceae bacterium]|nr:DNA polymerase III subunit gamma/tau [Rhodospirillaceae bacterium]MBT4427615.1 DNA polymerase III subunit gamma/tau [Rhodospirillaceae bacterium]MBT5674159.1 DNA polymerase III subunit gamma/tau [Rhodospirillaceae bacterium]MBT5780745.1 DNA polymerase III subunit gamma/tau [Rhodospirillaceae bacterium]
MGEEGPYRVLARKYRPINFSDLIGQEALVRTVTNAIRTGRLAHAFLLTGVRGVGKTSTARILARALNCTGAEGQDSGPTADPCGACEHCLAIAEDRHVDVLEMDAASHTGVDDMRELIDGVRYRPTSARYKVYIVDEVHMLSKQAFNALLKTLEEPPPHAKFIFATTEVRKLPVTVLSRCQRFDLRRVDAETLAAHFQSVAEKENAEIDSAAIRLIARAADGSVRDGLSLLDQAIAHGAGAAGEAEVRDMLGLADRARVFELFEAVMKGEIAAALDLLNEQYNAGADPITVLEDMLELTHWLTRVKLVPSVAEEPGIPEIERRLGQEMTAKLAMPELTRAWQMLLKGLGEARAAPHALMAVEMALVRLAYAADLPSPADAVRALEGSAAKPASAKPAPAAPAAPPPDSPAASGPAPDSNGGQTALAEERAPEPAPEPTPQPEASLGSEVTCLEDIVALAERHREMELRHWLVADVHLVRFSPGHIEIRQNENMFGNMAGTLGERLQDWTGARWMVSLSDKAGEPTLEEQAQARAAAKLRAAADDPLVRQVLKNFPDAEISGLREDGESGDKE